MNLMNERSIEKAPNTPVDLDYLEILQKQKELSAEMGFQIGYYEAKCHHTLDKIDHQIKNINNTLRGTNHG